MKFQSYAWFDTSSLNHYLSAMQTISTNIASLGFVQTSDVGQVVWPAITARVRSVASNGDGTVTYTYDNLSGGTLAVNQHIAVCDCKTSGFDTKLFLTRFAQQDGTAVTLTQAIRQTAQTFSGGNVTSITQVTSTMTVNGTFAGGAANGYANWVFTLAGFNNSVNNGTFMCTSSTGSTLVFFNSSGLAETPSGSPTVVSSVNTTSYVGNFSSTGIANGALGWVFTVTGFSNSGNNLTTIATANAIVASSNTAAAVTNSAGVNETHAGTATSTRQQAQFFGAITGGASDAYKNQYFATSGGGGSHDNGFFKCTGSSATQLSVTCEGALSETNSNLVTGFWQPILSVTTTSSTAGTFTITNATVGAEVAGQSTGLGAQTITTAAVGPTCTITHVQSSGTTATYTYSGLIGVLRNGQPITIVGTTTNSGGFNQCGNITSLSGSTFQIVGNNNGTIGSTSDSGVATVRCIANPSGANGTSYLFAPNEIWGSNDGLTPFYFKIEYGVLTTNTPSLYCTVGSATDGLGNITGNRGTRELVSYLSSSQDLTLLNECTFWGTGSGGALACLLWRASTFVFNGVFFGIERGKDSTGADSGSHVTFIYVHGNTAAASEQTIQLSGTQATFSVTSCDISKNYTGVYPNGASNAYTNYIVTVSGFLTPENNGTFGVTTSTATVLNLGTDYTTIAETPTPAATATICCGGRDIDVTCVNRVNNLPVTWVSGNNVVASPVFPSLGYFGNPLTMLVVFNVADVVEGQIVKVNIGGTTRTYLVTIKQYATYIGGAGACSALGIRFD